jgi:hypothetical protein
MPSLKLVPRPPKISTGGCQWVFAIKVGLDRQVDQLKAPLLLAK